MKVSDTFQIVSLDQRIGSVRLKAPFGAEQILASEKLAEKLKTVSQWSLIPAQQKNDNFNFEKIADILPKDEDYIFVNFRALSKTIVPGHWIDWSKDNVLEDSVPKLLGATVYPNHDFTNINNWLGSVASAVWDAEGANSEGIAGINATYKIDALMNPRIARGLLMQPPAIHSTSMTVLFKFEFSHPDIANDSRWRFMELLGEEVEGEIVRFIVTEIIEYWEASLVFQGADRLAKQYDTEEDFENFSAEKLGAKTPEKTAPIKNDKEKTMKLSKEQITTLGIEATGDEVPESQILEKALQLAENAKAFEGVNLTELKAKAETADAFVEEKRTEVRRLARLAELGAEEGDLDEVLEEQIAEASFERLQKLQTLYQKKAADRFPSGRSSQESSADVENAGGVIPPQTQPTVSTGGLV